MQAEKIYRKHFATYVDDYWSAYHKGMKEIIMKYIRSCNYLGLHVMETADPVTIGLICEIAYYGAGGRWEDLA